MDVLWTVLTLVLTFSTYGVLGAPPSVCCLPDQWQATIGTHGGIPTGGVPGVYDVEYRLAYDYPNKRWGMFNRNVYYTGDYAEFMYIEDYKERKMMQVSGWANIVLRMPEHLVDMRKYCTPEDAVITDSGRVGVGSESYHYNAYEWDFEYPKNKSAHFKALFMDDCTPIGEMSWFRDYNWNYTSYLNFLDMAGLEDKWSPFHQYEKYYRLNRSHRENWPTIDEDAFRPWHAVETFHFIKRLSLRKEVEFEDNLEPPQKEDPEDEEEEEDEDGVDEEEPDEVLAEEGGVDVKEEEVEGKEEEVVEKEEQTNK